MGNSARIPIVDDTRADAEALAASLAIDGLEMQDAIESLGHRQPHVFVLDISMPEHNGFAGSTCAAEYACDPRCGHRRVYGFDENRVLGDQSSS